MIIAHAAPLHIAFRNQLLLIFADFFACRRDERRLQFGIVGCALRDFGVGFQDLGANCLSRINHRRG
jgi:hypothetical protein